MRRLKQSYNYLRDGINQGLTVSGISVFLILLGIPATPDNGDGIAGFTLPIFVSIIIIFSILLVRKTLETKGWVNLLANGLAYGVVVAIVFSFTMGFINRWQADPDINLQDYLINVKLSTTERLSGVPVSELFVNPKIDSLTREFAPDAKLRANPMTLRINDEEATVFNFWTSPIWRYLRYSARLGT